MKLRLIAMAVSAAIAAGAHAGDHGYHHGTNPNAGELQFTNAPVPTSDLDKRSILTSQFAVIDGEQVEVNYNVIMRSGDKLGRKSLPFGTLIDIDGNPIIAGDGSMRVSNDNDFSSLVVSGNKKRGWKRGDDQVFMVSHFESRPAAMYLTQLQQDKATGKLTPLRTRPNDRHGRWGRHD